MLVDVLSLRRDGVKKSQAELRIAVPQRVTLTVRREKFSEHGPGSARTVVYAYLTVGEYRPEGQGQAELIGAVLTRMKGDSFVLVGSERVKLMPHEELQPQSWWCRLVRDDAASQPPV